ncbi:unnamed protein product [Dibothriocephalus latus]|uniref:Uncharacterized protein n=1 Tax=Dibothriocephalus latus TaxID=60516 RepID=A0A3P6TF80_DIBLA|nr:unnamed protein product [Dibothriocephalus latus]
MNTAMPDVDWQNRMYAGLTLVNDRVAVLEEVVIGRRTITAYTRTLDATAGTKTSDAVVCPLLLYMSRMDNFELFERKLQDLDFWQRAVVYLQMQGGKAPRVFVERMTNLLFDKRLMAKFSTSGRITRRTFVKLRHMSCSKVCI